jgi:hypothetical protein
MHHSVDLASFAEAPAGTVKPCKAAASRYRMLSTMQVARGRVCSLRRIGEGQLGQLELFGLWYSLLSIDRILALTMIKRIARKPVRR